MKAVAWIGLAHLIPEERDTQPCVSFVLLHAMLLVLGREALVSLAQSLVSSGLDKGEKEDRLTHFFHRKRESTQSPQQMPPEAKSLSLL